MSRLRAVSSSWRLRISVFRRVSSPCGISMGVGDVGWREVTALYVLPIWERASLIEISLSIENLIRADRSKKAGHVLESER